MDISGVHLPQHLLSDDAMLTQLLPLATLQHGSRFARFGRQRLRNRPRCCCCCNCTPQTKAPTRTSLSKSLAAETSRSSAEPTSESRRPFIAMAHRIHGTIRSVRAITLPDHSLQQLTRYVCLSQKPLTLLAD
jgi:hypothetical protein